MTKDTHPQTAEELKRQRKGRNFLVGAALVALIAAGFFGTMIKFASM